MPDIETLNFFIDHSLKKKRKKSMTQFILLLPSCKKRKDLSFNLSFSCNTAGFSNWLKSEHDERQLSKRKQKHYRKGNAYMFQLQWQNGGALSLKDQQCHNIILCNLVVMVLNVRIYYFVTVLTFPRQLDYWAESNQFIILYQKSSETAFFFLRGRLR